MLGTRYRKGVVSGKERPVELIISSPLTRCLQTAQLAFGIGARHGENHPCNGPPLITHECLREVHGIHQTDKRRTVSDLYDGPWNLTDHFGFTGENNEEDLVWKADRRESLRDLSLRISMFLSWVKERPEKKLVVITHGSWIEYMLKQQNVKYTNVENLNERSNQVFFPSEDAKPLNGTKPKMEVDESNSKTANCEVVRCDVIGGLNDNLEISHMIVKKAEHHLRLSKGEVGEKHIKLRTL